jgi:hypothetical protein
MSETKTTYVLPARRPMTPAERISHIGVLALRWARKQDAFERENGVDMVLRRKLMNAADAAQDRLRAACVAALAADPMLGAEEEEGGAMQGTG